MPRAYVPETRRRSSWESFLCDHQPDADLRAIVRIAATVPQGTSSRPSGRSVASNPSRPSIRQRPHASQTSPKSRSRSSRMSLRRTCTCSSAPASCADGGSKSVRCGRRAASSPCRCAPSFAQPSCSLGARSPRYATTRCQDPSAVRYDSTSVGISPSQGLNYRETLVVKVLAKETSAGPALQYHIYSWSQNGLDSSQTYPTGDSNCRAEQDWDAGKQCAIRKILTHLGEPVERRPYLAGQAARLWSIDGPSGYSSLSLSRNGTPGQGKIHLLFEGGPRGCHAAVQVVSVNLSRLLNGRDITTLIGKTPSSPTTGRRN